MAHNRAILLHVPYIVEIGFDLAEHADNSPKQNRNTNTDKKASLGILKRVVDKTHHNGGNLWVVAKYFNHKPLDYLRETKPLAHSHKKRKYRHYGQNGVIGQGRGFDNEIVVNKATHRENQFLEQAKQETS